jgi:hypothetical protein
MVRRRIASAWDLKYKSRLPELSRFLGIIIRMYAEAGAPHHGAHFHAYYQDSVGIFRIDPVEMIALSHQGSGFQRSGGALLW